MTAMNRLLTKITKAYEINANNIELIYNGINKVFRIYNSTENHVLKIFNKKECTQYRVSFERKILAHISSNNVDCIQPILPNTNTEQTYTFENQNYFGILTRECFGTSYSAGNTNTQNSLFGRALHKLHNCPVPPVANPRRTTTNPSQFITRLRENNTSRQIKSLKNIILNLFQNIEETTTPYATNTKRCICHGDAWPGNAIYSMYACTLIDFEHTKISDPAFDIATFMWWLTGSDFEEMQKMKIWNSFISGYGNTIESHINEHTLALIKINQLRSLTFLYNNIFINDEILELAHQQTSFLLNRTTTYSSHEQLVKTLWKI